MIKYIQHGRIKKLCEKYDIRNYSINQDELIDVDGDVNLRKKDLKKIPLTFNKVFGSFDCSGNKLTSLKGCPKIVGKNSYNFKGFNCSDNLLRYKF